MIVLYNVLRPYIAVLIGLLDCSADQVTSKTT